MNHLKAGECNNSSWRCSNKVGRTPSVKSRETLLLKYFLYAIDHTRVTLFWVVALFLKPWANYLYNHVRINLYVSVSVNQRQLATNNLLSHRKQARSLGELVHEAVAFCWDISSLLEVNSSKGLWFLYRQWRYLG